MNDTLGKRIAGHRKAKGLTQDQLAERLGVTAQAVSKWENDQSCPDITTLPKLAQIFGTTTDALLGVETVHTAEVVNDKEPEGEHLFDVQISEDTDGKKFEFHYDAGRKGGIGLALWVLCTAAMLLVSEFFYQGAFGFWDCLWPTGLLIFGLSGLYPKFSVFQFGCALFGGYYVVNQCLGVGITLDKGLWLPLILLMFGLSLLTEALKKKGNGGIHVRGPKKESVNHFDSSTDSFECETVFGGNHHQIQCPRLRRGTAEVVFGELTVDLSGCEAFAEDCTITAECVFGHLRLLVPKRCRVVHSEDKTFANLDIHGSPAPDAEATVYLDCDISFGNLEITYV